MRRARADHVVIKQDHFECLHCGATTGPVLPCLIVDLKKTAAPFAKAHRGCLKPPRSPMRLDPRVEVWAVVSPGHESSPSVWDTEESARTNGEPGDRIVRMVEAIETITSPTWPYVLAFAKRMEAKLALNRHKGDRGGWINNTADELLERLKEELEELEGALLPHPGLAKDRSQERRADEAADVANFAMMIADVCGGVKP